MSQVTSASTRHCLSPAGTHSPMLCPPHWGLPAYVPVRGCLLSYLSIYLILRYAAQAGLELTSLLPQLPKYWDYSSGHQARLSSFLSIDKCFSCHTCLQSWQLGRQRQDGFEFKACLGKAIETLSQKQKNVCKNQKGWECVSSGRGLA